jgi:GT2 family glycosyltransferase
MKSSEGFANGKKPGQFLRVLAYLRRKFDNRPYILSSPQLQQKHHLDSAEKKVDLPKVSIIIPTRDKSELLRKCLLSIRAKTSYPNYEIIVVNNQSLEPAALSLLDSYRRSDIKVLDFNQPFNFSRISNFAAANSSGQFLCFLNNDTEILTENWLSSMVKHAAHKEVGVVGGLLTYPDGTIQHMGVALGYTGVAGHPGRGKKPTDVVPDSCYAVSGVTFACAMVSKAKFQELGGLDENFPVGFNDVDFCVRSNNRGFRNVVCLNAKLVHSESQTRKRTFTVTGAIQAAKDVLEFLRVNRTSFEERFFSVQASE